MTLFVFLLTLIFGGGASYGGHVHHLPAMHANDTLGETTGA
jgi:hypothetical protein